MYVSNTAGSSDAALDLDLTYSAAAASTEVPGPVTALTAAVSGTSITLQWTKPACDGSSFITSYSIALSPATVTVPAVAVTDPFQTAYLRSVSSLAACTAYTITVRAVNAAGQSSAVSVSATTSCTVLSQFSLLTGAAASNTAGTHSSMSWRWVNTCVAQQAKLKARVCRDMPTR